MSAARTLVEKIWDSQVVRAGVDGPDLIYIDLHFVHEVSSPQAFDGLRLAGRPVRRPDLTVAVEDHNVPTDTLVIKDETSRRQVEALQKNCEEFGIELYRLGEERQGIVHVIGPGLGLTQPGMTIVCGDSHTSTHGAFGAIAFGIGTSEVEHVLATQTLVQQRPKTMGVTIDGTLRPGVTSKDVALTLISEVGTGAGQGYIVEYRGEVVESLSMEARMSLCNLSIEWGARAGLVAPDDTTFAYLRTKPFAPRGDEWDKALEAWKLLFSDDDAVFDAHVRLDGSSVVPFITWGTNPGQGVSVAGRVPSPDEFDDPDRRHAAARALDYMGLTPGVAMRDVPVDVVFIGSCTNGRIEDLRIAAELLDGRKVATRVEMLVVPGSMEVKRQAEAEGLDAIFTKAGAQWRGAGCSMCLGMNPDVVATGKRSASTSNRNFEGRQGPGARTHLVSPAVAAATAVKGHFAEPGDL